MDAELRPNVGDISKLKMFAEVRYAMGKRALGMVFKRSKLFRSTLYANAFWAKGQDATDAEQATITSYHIPYHTPLRFVKLPEKRSFNH